MSEVKRYMESCGEGGGVVEHRNGDLVSIKDFDRVTAERDAAKAELETSRSAFKEELDGAKYTRRRFRQERDALQQRLTTAHEKNDALSTAYVRAGEQEHELRLRLGLLEGLLQRVVHASVLSFESGAPEHLESLEVDICAALKQEECCTVSAQDRALLQAGDYTPEELFGIGGKPSCPKCAKL